LIGKPVGFREGVELFEFGIVERRTVGLQERTHLKIKLKQKFIHTQYFAIKRFTKKNFLTSPACKHVSVRFIVFCLLLNA
jgi:hypothetical protein